MVLLKFIHIVFFLLIKADSVVDERKGIIRGKEYNSVCDKVTVQPSFKVKQVVGKKWRVFYSWNSNLADLCVDVSFKLANPLMINRIRSVMEKHLATQPIWEDGELFLSMSTSRKTLLVVDRNRERGQFIQVPHMIKDQFLRRPAAREISLYRMALKTLHQGRFLVMSDCSVGVTLLLAHLDWQPDLERITAVAKSLDFGDPFPACL